MILGRACKFCQRDVGCGYIERCQVMGQARLKVGSESRWREAWEEKWSKESYQRCRDMARMMSKKHGGEVWSVEMRWFWGRLQGRIRELGSGRRVEVLVREAIAEDRRMDAEVNRRVEERVLELNRREEIELEREVAKERESLPLAMRGPSWERKWAQRRIDLRVKHQARLGSGSGGVWQRGQMRTA